MRAAFLGLGLMGEPIAANLARSGADLIVWNRSADAAERLRALGAIVVPSARQALRNAAVPILMLRNSKVTDLVLERGTSAFTDNVAGRILVNMGTVAPDYSLALAREIGIAGGQYVECPVSGSRNAAEAGQLIAMVAGHEPAIDAIKPLVRLTTADIFSCGPVPGALRTKLAVNLFLITMVTGLAEAMHFARSRGIDADIFRRILDAGPMASFVSRGKLDKLVSGDMNAQAAISDVRVNAELIRAEADRLAIVTPLLDTCRTLLKNAVETGEGDLDMIGVIRAIARQHTSDG